MTRSKKVSEETFATTLAILKNVSAPVTDDAKENKSNKRAKSPDKPAPKPEPKPEPEPKAEPAAEPEAKPESRYHIFPRSAQTLPCAQYKTDKGYRCPNCHRCYNARKNLVRHVTLECGREPQYKCPHCSYSKHRRNELKKHIEKKHPAHAHAPAASPAAPAAAPAPLGVK